MDDELLIELVRNNELLYNKCHRDYKNIEKKNSTWRKIAEELGFSESDCLRRWSCLRDRYAKELRRMSALAVNGMTTTRFWPFYNEMEFLKPFITSRNNRISGSASYSIRVKVTPPIQSRPLSKDDSDNSTQYEHPAAELQSNDLIDNEEMENTQIETLLQSDSLSSSQYDDQIKSENVENCENEQKTFYNKKTQRLRYKRKRPCGESDAESQLSNALEDFKKICDLTKIQHQNPAVYGFGQMIMETLCSMSERKQAKAMQKVTEIVMNLKMEPENINE